MSMKVTIDGILGTKETTVNPNGRCVVTAKEFAGKRAKVFFLED
jgi:hypothetical protein